MDCRACETRSHCTAHGCIPFVTEEGGRQIEFAGEEPAAFLSQEQVWQRTQLWIAIGFSLIVVSIGTAVYIWTRA